MIYTVTISCPSINNSRTLASLAIEEKLVACAQIIPEVESHFVWEGKLNIENESLVIFKTIESKLEGLEKLIIAEHPYDTPEIIIVKADKVAEGYQKWCEESLS